MNFSTLNLRSLSLLAVCSLLMSSCQPTDTYTISGSIEGLEDGTVLNIKDAGKDYAVVDSIVVMNGQINKSGIVDPLGVYSVVVNKPRLYFNLFLDGEKIAISGKADDSKSIRLRGTPANDLMSAYQDSLIPWQMAGVNFRKQMAAAKTKEEKNSAIEEYKKAYELKNQDDYTKEFVANNPDNLAILAIFQNVSPSFFNISVEEGTALLNAMSTRLQQTPAFNTYKVSYDKLALLVVGNKAPGFNGLDPEGNPLAFENIRGSKLTLIDFWASWCKPCRAEYPKLRKVYSQFKDEGFEIVGVSLDDANDKWVKAIEEEQINWPQISNIKGFKDPIADTYQVMAIPSYFLVDQEGIIVSKGTDLRSNMVEEIEKFLK